MKRTLNVGIVGAGGWGENIVSAYNQNNFAEVVAISDLDKERAKLIAKKYGVKRFYSDYQEMITKEHLDIVSIATPDFAHRQVVCDCLSSGLNVFLEKPVATTMSDCEAIVKEIQKTNKKFMTNYFMRFIPQFREAKLAVETGELGDIVQGYARIDDCISVPTSMLKWSIKSSPVFFIMIHNIDAIRWIIGKEAVEVYAKQQRKKLQGEGYNTSDSVQVIVTFEDDVTVLFDSNWILPRTFDGLNDQILRIVGTEGVAYINNTYQGLQVYKPEFKGKFEHANRSTVYINPMYNNKITGCVQRSVDHFVDCIINDTEPIITLKDAIEPTRIACAIMDSLVSGEKIIIKR